MGVRGGGRAQLELTDAKYGHLWKTSVDFNELVVLLNFENSVVNSRNVLIYMFSEIHRKTIISFVTLVMQLREVINFALTIRRIIFSSGRIAFGWARRLPGESTSSRFDSLGICFISANLCQLFSLTMQDSCP